MSLRFEKAAMTRMTAMPLIHTMPAEEVPATDFALSVDGHAVPMHRARVSAYPVNEFWPDHQRPLSQTEIASFASWEMTAPVEVEVVSRRPVQSVRVRPMSARIGPVVEGEVIRFTVTRPGQYAVEVNGSHQALHLFADAPEGPAPDPEDPDVRFFGPGVHCPGLIRMESGQILYLASGAVVYGAVLAEGASNLVVRGRGILDGSKFARASLTGLITLYDCDEVYLEGVTMRDSGGFTVVPMACRNVRIENVKIIGNWRYNSDGIDFCNCRDCSVTDSFIRAFDDCICVKGYESFGKWLYRLRLVDADPSTGRLSVDGVVGSFAELQQRFGSYPCPADVCRDISVRRCVIWCDWGRPLEVGAETVADEIRNLSFEDCDLIHLHGAVAMSVQNADRAVCREIVFRGIRVEIDDEPRRPVIAKRVDQPYVAPYDGYLPALVRLANQVGCVWTDSVRGRIEDVSFRDIEVTAPAMPPIVLIGHDADHLVRRVSFHDLRLNGRVVTDLESARVTMNEFVRDVELGE
jgi:hypothetical protein